MTETELNDIASSAAAVLSRIPSMEYSTLVVTGMSVPS